MAVELIECPFCGCKYTTDVNKIVEDGEAVSMRPMFSGIKKIFTRKVPKSLYIDLSCPKCKKVFEWEVKE